MKNNIFDAIGDNIIECVMDYYSDTEEDMANCLCYLYHNLNDSNIKYKICDILYDLEYCADCGSKLVAYTYEETHTELFGNQIEYITEMICPNCD